MSRFIQNGNTLCYEHEQERLIISFLGEEIVRVQSTINYNYTFKNFALEENIKIIEAKITIDEKEAIIESGSLKVSIQKTSNEKEGYIKFFRKNESIAFLKEVISPRAYAHKGRMYSTLGGDEFSIEQTFVSDDSEKFYGFGQHHHGYLDNKGITFDIEHRNSEIFIPVLISNKKYGFLWNNPALGRCELSKHQTRWIADKTKQLDYCVFIGDDYKSIMHNYAKITGYPPMMPDYAMGYWQCKLRYLTQNELLDVAREYKKRNIPLSVIVVDFLHWTKFGEWEFDREFWPDPKSMVDELKSMGIKLMVSIWPAVSILGKYTDEMLKNGYLLTAERGDGAIVNSMIVDGVGSSYVYDPTTPESREYLWNIIKKNYLDIGIEIFWLDACEPEFRPLQFDNIRCRLGSMKEYGGMYPKFIQQAFYEGMKKDGVDLPINLCRSAWAGSQKYGAAVWSGDIDSTFKSLRESINAGLNMALSGIPWWTTDIGGFHGGDISNEMFKELVVRWFQYAVFCPILRMHGVRTNSANPHKLTINPKDSAGHPPNEVWSFGEEILDILETQINLREKLRNYVTKISKISSECGEPMMRPMFFDFPDDDNAYIENYQFMFGSDILVAPIVEYKSRERGVYLPSGVKWKNLFTEEIFEGGQTIICKSPLENIPVFVKDGKNIFV